MNGYPQVPYIAYPSSSRRPRASRPSQASKPKSTQAKPLSDGQKANIAREFIESSRSVPIKFEGSEHKTHLRRTDIRLHLSNAEVSKVVATMLKGIGSMKGRMTYVPGTLLSEGKVRLEMTVGLAAELSTKMSAAMQLRAASTRTDPLPNPAENEDENEKDEEDENQANAPKK